MSLTVTKQQPPREAPDFQTPQVCTDEICEANVINHESLTAFSTWRKPKALDYINEVKYYTEGDCPLVSSDNTVALSYITLQVVKKVINYQPNTNEQLWGLVICHLIIYP